MDMRAEVRTIVLNCKKHAVMKHVFEFVQLVPTRHVRQSLSAVLVCGVQQ